MNAWEIAVAALAGVVVYTVGVAAPLGVLIGRTIRRANREQARR